MDSYIPESGLRAALASFSAVVLLAATTIAGENTGYCVQYDFPDQGDDWYAGESAPDPRYDFHGTLSQPFGDGNDFDLGFYPSHDPDNLGPPLTATQTSLYEYVFRHGELSVPDNPAWGGGGGVCHTNGDCADSSYCNGVEVCTIGGFCQGGSPVYCGDGDSCTADSCYEPTNSCVHTPITAPGEVQSLNLWKLTPGSADIGLAWFPRLPSDTYNVYRATAADLADVACLQYGLLTTSGSDTDPLVAGNLFFYLATGYGCGGESTLGSDSIGSPRSNPAPCPVAP